MPRNVVTLRRRTLVLPTRRNREARDRIEGALEDAFRARREGDALQMDFSKREVPRTAKERVAAELDRIDPSWRRLYSLYPRDSNVRERGG